MSKSANTLSPSKHSNSWQQLIIFCTFAVAPEFELTEWATKKVNHRMWKSANWEVRGIAMCAVYQVLTPYGSHIVDFIKNECTCRY